MIINPAVAGIDCNDCLKYVYDLKTGRPQTVLSVVDGKEAEVKVPFPSGKGPICTRINDVRKGCPKGQPFQRELNAKNRMAFEHFSECDAVGSFPKDATVRRNAGVIRQIKQQIEEAKRDSQLTAQRLLVESLNRVSYGNS